MELTFSDQEWSDLETHLDKSTKWNVAVVRAYRKVLRIVRDADDERDIRAMKSLRMEKLKGDREGDYSLRLNDQWRLTFRIIEATPKNTIHILRIEDYHK